MKLIKFKTSFSLAKKIKLSNFFIGYFKTFCTVNTTPKVKKLNSKYLEHDPYLTDEQKANMKRVLVYRYNNKPKEMEEIPLLEETTESNNFLNKSKV